MESFDSLVDRLFKPLSDKSNIMGIISRGDDQNYTHCRDIVEKYYKQTPDQCIYSKYVYSQAIVKPYYGYDIGEPVSKICKRILEKPNRFHSVKESKRVVISVPHYPHTVRFGIEYREEEITPQLLVLQDKDTQVKFIVKSGIIKNLSYLTGDENKLLVACIEEWYNHNREQIAEKEKRNEQKRKDKFRQEMIEQYKDL